MCVCVCWWYGLVWCGVVWGVCVCVCVCVCEREREREGAAWEDLTSVHG